jgi:transposase
MAKKKKRKSISVKEQAVMRLFKGEDMELVSRETGCTMYELTQWRDKYMLAGKENLKSHPRDARDTELEQRDQFIAKLALENEILKKAGAVMGSRK